MSENNLDKTYNPENIEARWYQHWESEGYFKPNDDGTPYCIMLPPPNVTGTLHMGHGFQVSLMDALIRYNSMCGKSALWQPGADHAGIATQMVVENQLAKNNIKRTDIGREKFVEHVWDWKNQSGNTIQNQLRRMGASLDWSRDRFTMDDGFVHAVHEVFIRLYNEGLIYRGKTLVNWDPKLHTAISDLEVNNVEANGHLWYIRYPVVSTDEFVIIATTRPETMLGDTAVAINPSDKRYKHLIGKTIKLPLTDREIPIITDDYVDPEFGTGCVKITPAHDFNDYDIGKRHNLEMINILTPEANLNESVPEKYQGLDRFVARKMIVNDLEDINLLEKIDDYKITVPKGDRSGEILEPYLTDQWFVKATPLAKPAIEAVKSGKIKFVPENWSKIYFQWMENIQDWCISRQLWWGHRIPAWFDEQGNIYVGHNEADVRKQHNLGTDVVLRQDEDVLDTWFSSALWPFVTLGWPEKTVELNKYYPGSVLVTGFDIIFFWVARMVMMGLKFMDDVPFHTVYITGLIRDAEGQKMSKSKGNVLDPLDLIDGISLDDLVAKRTGSLMIPKLAKAITKATKKEFPDGIESHGTDAVRFTYCALATTGRDVRFDMRRLESHRNFTNKIWNAARYVLMNTEGKAIEAPASIQDLNLCDRWILSKLNQTVKDVHHFFEEYRFDWIAQTLYEFIWNEYCDWYLELSKPALISDDYSETVKANTRHTLITVLETIMRLTHPLMPYITEEIWQRVSPLTGIKAKSIVTQPYPQIDPALIDQKADEEIEWLKAIIVAIRNIRGEMNIPPSKKIPVLLAKGDDTDRARVKNNANFLSVLAKLDSINWLGDETAPAAATSIVNNLEILIPMAGLIDKDAEQSRLNKEISKLEKELTSTEMKLANESFISKAPEVVVEKEKHRANEIQHTITLLQEKLEHIATL